MTPSRSQPDIRSQMTPPWTLWAKTYSLAATAKDPISLDPATRSVSAKPPDMLRPPTVGTLPNMKWSFADSHARIEDGGWARQTTVCELPTSVELACVNMRLDEGARAALAQGGRVGVYA
ncbi:hypothetical protein F5Y13DRAFT_201904 [Hypoxylon sp. FL1857]|nr:hypothetical protein F5Y13DRAFT_201904 [Hypoxylon sp. FL1857]